VPKLDLDHMKGALNNLMASFPDLTFNLHKTKIAKQKDGGWAADIVVMGTHTGAAYTPMPGKLPPVETTGKKVLIGPETFSLYIDAAGKVTATKITPLHEGAPAGPPGFYTEVGGVIPKPPAAGPPPMDLLMAATVKDFDDWFSGFKEHATSTTFTIAGKTFKDAPISRSDAMDESKTEVFTDFEDKNKAFITFYGVDMAKFGAFMEWDHFKEMSDLAVVEQDPPSLIVDPPAPGGDAPPPEGKPTMFVAMEVKDVDTWFTGFKAHASSKTGTWGVEVKYTRAEVCDDSKTRVFQSAHNPKRVGVLVCDIDMPKFGEMMADPTWAVISEALGEVKDTSSVKVVAPMPAPPAPAP